MAARHAATEGTLAAHHSAVLSQTGKALGGIITALLLRKVGKLTCDIMVRGGSASAWLCSIKQALQRSLALNVNVAVLALAALAVVALLVRLAVWARQRDPVYIVDFTVHNADPSWRFSRADVRRLGEANDELTADDVAFMDKLAFRSGLGDQTAVVPAIQQAPKSKPGMEPARDEYEKTCFSCVAQLFEKTRVRPSQIKFVITNSSLFNPTPSLSAALINRFKLRDDVINYSLGGMGCSAGVVALDLARQMLQLHPGSYALVVSHENITNNFYTGSDKSMLIANTLFRANGAAVLLSSRPADAATSKYTLKHIVRTIMAADDEAYRCVWQTEDSAHKQGVALRKELIGVAGRAVARNMARLGPLVLPYSEQARYAASALLRAAVKAAPAKLAATLPQAWKKPYTPDFARAFDAACIHTGGRGVIDSMEENLGMSKQMVEASRASLFQFGNTSSCSVWYELAYAETFRGGLRRGARVWQIAFGSGFKCNSAVLVANRAIKDMHPAWSTFDVEKMYAQLDQIDQDVAASRARRAAEKAAAASSSISG